MLDVLGRSLVEARCFKAVTAAAEAQALRAGLPFEDFGWYLQYFEVEFRQVVLLQDFVDSIVKCFKKTRVWIVSLL